MDYVTRDVQARCAALGVDPGPIDGIPGPMTRAAVEKAMEQRGVDRPEMLFHPSGLHRVIMHWTAGAYGAIALERRHYHLLVTCTGQIVMGDLAPEANADCRDGRYAAHTRALNTGSIGVAVDAMGGAVERPFDPGPYPITEEQAQALVRAVADLCLTYDIPVSRYSVLTHAEVQPTLGVWQRNKWDITWLPGMEKPADPLVVGDMIRAGIKDQMPA